MSDCIHGVYVGREWAFGRGWPAFRAAVITNHLMCAQAYRRATLYGAGRRTSRRFHVIQKCLGA
eukprot:5261211-Pyramimonas_sp.AAC.1